MTRTEIRKEAKGFVEDQLLDAIEFGREKIQNVNHGQYTSEDVDAIAAEVAKQAESAIRRLYR